MSWTPDRIEQLIRLREEGLSASQIARQLGGVTRNAVIGKIHRLGLATKNQPKEAEPSAGAKGKAEASAPAPEAPPKVAPAAAAVKPAGPAAAAKPAAAATPARAPAASASARPATGSRSGYDAPRPPAGGVGVPSMLPPEMGGLPISDESEALRRKVAEVEANSWRLPLLKLTERTCRWPIGDPTDPAFHFCGLPSVPGKPYCDTHVQLAYQPANSRRNRSRPPVRPAGGQR